MAPRDICVFDRLFFTSDLPTEVAERQRPSRRIVSGKSFYRKSLSLSSLPTAPNPKEMKFLSS